MATGKDSGNLSDIVAAAVSPALIMALVGSLVFFLVEVLYVGVYSSQLLWGLFFFVFAAVLIARIAIQSPRKAGVYALLLALPVWLTLQFYVEYPEDSPIADAKWAINLGLMGLIWWSAHRLTRDCTYIDENSEVAGQGLLEAAGLEKQAVEEEAPAAEDDKEPTSWWERYRRYRERRQKRRTPGVWVVYFSLAALPLFGLGQSLIPIEEEARRRHAFWLMIVYVGSGLGLLLTTTFLGLRHYLRQRQVRIPASMAGIWLMMGGGLIVVLLAAGALLPRPQAEYPLVDLPGLGSPERHASRWAMKDGAPGKGEGRPSSQQPRGEQKNEGDANGQGKRGQGEGQSAEGQRGTKSGQGKSGEGKSGEASSGNQQGQTSGNQGSSRDKTGDDRNNGDRQPGQTSGRQGQPREGNAGRRPQERQPQQGTQAGGQKPAQDQSGQSPDNSAPSPPPKPSFLASLAKLLAGLLPLLKWIVFGIFVAVVLFLVLRGVLQFLANFTNWARDLLNALRAWWEGLFSKRNSGATVAAEAEDRVQGPPPEPFASYSNPFRDGSARRQTPAKLVRYSFEALQAWAWEHELGRRPDETALEFAARLGDEVPALEAEARRLAALYAHVLYGRGSLPAGALASLEQFWLLLEAVAEQPLSA